MSVKRLAGLLALVLPVLAACAAQDSEQAAGEPPPIIPLTHFFDNPEIAGAQISPDGLYLSYLKPYRGRLNVHVRRLGSEQERVMTRDTVRPVFG
ncbi:MAG: S9 family peptidase, partial [Gemmatimonadetes bacterium]|nr:S9 family peptidase [Gemmatimonadota bacterium]NIQ53411.1 S9 family peptidase [Gemmatimonadota bacterium]NIU73557.1 S9 family peptidase [Gammaproteobacteria bacterium]NIX43755.1 S9 family peptidase [Gemmatimonadota bacterium]NIY07951.1 S9 family peptidase [Gemmatimonadota bacterium]